MRVEIFYTNLSEQIEKFIIYIFYVHKKKAPNHHLPHLTVHICAAFVLIFHVFVAIESPLPPPPMTPHRLRG